VTQWQWGLWNSFVHDAISTDKRNPTLYPYGNVYGLDMGQDFVWALDPLTNSISSYKVPVRQVGYNKRWDFGGWPVYTQVANPHNPMMDDKGHLWMTTEIRDDEIRPKWAKDVLVYQDGFGPVQIDQAASTSSAPAAGPASEGAGHHRQLGYFDIKTKKFVLIDTAYGTHHLQFDSQGRVWTSLDATSLGMFDPSKFDPADPLGTEGQAQKMFEKIDQKTGKSVAGGGYGIIVNPVDGTVWRANPSPGGASNKLNKFDPKTTTFTDYPLPPPGRGPRGIDASTDGLIWFATGSGHLGRFDPKTEKFTYWETPGPKIKGTGPETGSADFHYYIWVDQFNTLGMGNNMVIVNGSNSDSLLVFDPSTEKFTVLRVPYPLSFFQRGVDGRIDDPNAGWKGRGLWVPNSDDPIIFEEKVHLGYIAHIQMRPNPLAQ
jgi:streptogramin lyase